MSAHYKVLPIIPGPVRIKIKRFVIVHRTSYYRKLGRRVLPHTSLPEPYTTTVGFRPIIILFMKLAAAVFFLFFGFSRKNLGNLGLT
ncbi:hypothetical protein QTP88_024243 [Uroleucon formosanum]